MPELRLENDLTCDRQRDDARRSPFKITNRYRNSPNLKGLAQDYTERGVAAQRKVLTRST